MIESFKRFIEHKAATTQLYPIEEHFLAGECIQLRKKPGRTLLLRLVQTHFKGKEYSAYKRPTEGKEEAKESRESKPPPKYFERRYYLFSKFDAGIQLDEESTCCQSERRLVLCDP